MRVQIIKVSPVIAFLCLNPALAFAAEGSYVCAVDEVYECLALDGCKRVALKQINMSALMTVDLDKKQLTSATMDEKTRTEDIEGVTSTEKVVFLYGTQEATAWNATMSLATGKLAGGISSDTSSFAFFGNCTKK